MKSGSCPLTKTASVLLILGGLNWGLVGLMEYNFVDQIFVSAPVVATVVYILVGLSALWMLYKMFAGGGSCCK